jgi:hypothetical protein
VIRASHHDDVVARVWSLFVGMLGGAAIVGVLLVGHALFFDGGDNGIAATGTTASTSVTTTDPASATTTTAAGADAPTTGVTPTSIAPEATAPTSAVDTLGALGNDTPIDPNVDPVPAPPAGTVTLLDVFTENDLTIATVMVDADSYNVAAGDTFAADYRVDAINGRCAQFRHGGNAFELCVGASIQT